MNEKEEQLLLKYLKKHFSDEEVKELILNYPLTGENGLRRMLGEIDIEYFALTYLSDHFDKPFCTFHHDLINHVKSLTSEYSCSTKEDEIIYRREKTGQKLLCIAPRGHGKSRIVYCKIKVQSFAKKKCRELHFINK